jgi:hypothetical protein
MPTSVNQSATSPSSPQSTVSEASDSQAAILLIVFGPVRRLYCCCCGGNFQGRQFHNQDTGYGMGPCCADQVLKHRPFGQEPMSLEEFQRTYGIAGVNFDVPE